MAAGAVAGGLSLVGGGLQTAAKFKEMDAQAEAELRNASFFLEQAEFFGAANRREQDIFSRELEDNIDSQVAGFIKGGVELSGSALTVIAESERLGELEKIALEREGEFRVRGAKLRAKESFNNAKSLFDPDTRALTMLGTLIDAGGAAARAGLAGRSRAPSSNGAFSKQKDFRSAKGFQGTTNTSGRSTRGGSFA